MHNLLFVISDNLEPLLSSSRSSGSSSRSHQRRNVGSCCPSCRHGAGVTWTGAPQRTVLVTRTIFQRFHILSVTVVQTRIIFLRTETDTKSVVSFHVIFTRSKVWLLSRVPKITKLICNQV